MQHMERKLLTKARRAAYRLRQQVTEPVFGQIKNKGLVRLLLRGEENCRAEWLLFTARVTTSASSRWPWDEIDGRQPVLSATDGAASKAPQRTTAAIPVLRLHLTLLHTPSSQPTGVARTGC